MMSLQRVSLFALLLLACLGAEAQQSTPQRTDTIRRELTVVSDAELSLTPATPLGSNYRFDNPKVSQPTPIPPLATRDFTPAVLMPLFPAVSPLAAQVPTTHQGGYISLATGLTDPFVGQVGYTRQFRERHTIDIQASQVSSWGHMLYFNEGPRYAIPYYYHRSQGQAAYRYQGDRSLHTLRIAGGWESANYYSVYSPLHKDYKPPTRVSPEYKQDFELLSYEYTTRDTRPLATRGTIALSHWGRNYAAFAEPHNKRADEGRILSQWHIAPYQWGSSALLVEATLLGQINASDYQALQYDHNSFLPLLQFAAEVAPQFYTEGVWARDWTYQLQAGAGVGFASLYKQELVAFPKIKASLKWRKTNELYLHADGGIKGGDMLRASVQNRYVHPNYGTAPEMHFVDSEWGLRTFLPYGVSLSVAGGYSYIQKASLWNIRHVTTKNVPQPATPFYAFGRYQRDLHQAHFSGRVAYAYGTRFDVSAAYTYFMYTLPQGGVAEGRPQKQIDVTFRVNPSPKFTLGFESQQALGIPFYRQHLDGVKLDTTYLGRLSLFASWHFLPMLSVYARAGGFSNYQSVYYRSHPFIDALVGLSANF